MLCEGTIEIDDGDQCGLVALGKAVAAKRDAHSETLPSFDGSWLILTLRAEIRLSKLEGSIGIFDYVAMDAKVAIEVTPKPPPTPPPSTRPETVAVPVQLQEPSTNWARWIGVGLIVTATGIVVATIVEDFLTAGVGTADDPASAAAAGAALARGLAMLGVGGLALPKADRPANIKLEATITLPER